MIALGKNLGDHADAMGQHLAVMRDQANGDASLLPAIGDLAADIQGMKSDAQAAIDAGQRLADEARNVARSIGATIE